MAQELVKLKVDLIFAVPSNAVAAAHAATSSIPIVFLSVADPLGSGFATSLAHPGLNLTGVTNVVGDLTGKRLQLFKQLVPGLTRIAILVTPKSPNYPALVPRFQATAQALGLSTTVTLATLPLDLEPVFEKIVSSQVQGVYVWGDPYLWVACKQVADLALRRHLPTMSLFVEHVDAGGLMSYGADTLDWMRLCANLVDKIFRGAKPGDLPIEQPSTFELVINHKTADALGLEIPRLLRMQATRIVE